MSRLLLGVNLDASTGTASVTLPHRIVFTRSARDGVADRLDFKHVGACMYGVCLLTAADQSLCDLPHLFGDRYPCHFTHIHSRHCNVIQ